MNVQKHTEHRGPSSSRSPLLLCIAKEVVISGKPPGTLDIILEIHSLDTSPRKDVSLVYLHFIIARKLKLFRVAIPIREGVY